MSELRDVTNEVATGRCKKRLCINLIREIGICTTLVTLPYELFDWQHYGVGTLFRWPAGDRPLPKKGPETGQTRNGSCRSRARACHEKCLQTYRATLCCGGRILLIRRGSWPSWFSKGFLCSPERISAI